MNAGNDAGAAVESDRWPACDLEFVGECPACGSSDRSAMISGLTDKVFFVAGTWTLYRCDGCTAAYLDPRPNGSSIGRAYVRYYTHAGNKADFLSFWQGNSFRKRVKAGYLNSRYGYALANALPFVGSIAKLLPNATRDMDFAIRHLPAPTADGDKLLDVGSGSGDFLVVAEALGYRASGLEPDGEAVALSRTRGLDVEQGLLPDRDFAGSGYAQITLNHVLEHLHQPREAVRQMLEMLVPGGRLWLSQPNLGAIGLERFKGDWRGLEPPRHLSLYDYRGLKRLLEDAGFVDVAMLGPELAASFYFRQSAAMSAGLDPYAGGQSSWTAEIAAEASAADMKTKKRPERGESLTVVAFRPKKRG